jgi:hypothetical protein
VPAPLFLLARHAPHEEELGIGLHARKAGHAVGQAEEGRDGGNVPDVLVVEPCGYSASKSASQISWLRSQTFMAKSSMARWRGLMSALR